MREITFTIDGMECSAKGGQYITQAAAANGIYIPTLCNFEGLKPAGTCRICTVKVGGRFMAACTTPVAAGMVVENKTPELENIRKAIIEMLFVEGNHMCPTCEKSGNCELQALGYRYQMMVPRFPFLFPVREVDGSYPKILIDHNRCVQCHRCIRGITASDGKSIFGLAQRGGKTKIIADADLAAGMSEEQARKAMEICPVGSILRKEIGFAVPIGKRLYDFKAIGSAIESGK